METRGVDLRWRDGGRLYSRGLDGENMRVLLLSSYSGNPRTWKMAKTLSKEGYDVWIAEWDRSGSLPEKEMRDGLKILRFRRASPYGPLAAFKMLMWMGWVFAILVGGRFDAVQARNLDTLIPSMLARVIRRFVLIYDLSDFYADSHVRAPLIRWVVSYVERALTTRTDLLILVSPRQVEQLKGYLPRRVIVLYNSYPTRLPRKDRQGRTLVYVGTLGMDRCRSILQMARIARAAGYGMVVAGFGDCESYLRELGKRVEGFRFLGRIGREEALELTSSASMVIAYYDPRDTYNHVINLPNKFMDALMMGRPVIVARGTYMAEIADREGVGISVDLNRPEEVILILRSVSEDDLKNMGERARKLFEERFSWERCAETYLRNLRSILSDRDSEGSWRSGPS